MKVSQVIFLSLLASAVNAVVEKPEIQPSIRMLRATAAASITRDLKAEKAQGRGPPATKDDVPRGPLEPKEPNVPQGKALGFWCCKPYNKDQASCEADPFVVPNEKCDVTDPDWKGCEWANDDCVAKGSDDETRRDRELAKGGVKGPPVEKPSNVPNGKAFGYWCCRPYNKSQVKCEDWTNPKPAKCLEADPDFPGCVWNNNQCEAADGGP